MRPYTAAFRASARRVLQDRSVLVARITIYLVILGVLTALWRAAVDAGGGELAGYTFPALLWYLTFSEAAQFAIDPRLIEYVGSDIGTGNVTVEMLRPISVVRLRIASSMGEACIRFTCTCAVGCIFTWWQVGPPPAIPVALLAVPCALLAIICNLAAQHAFAGLAFWLRDAKAAWFLYQKLIFLAGGMLLPLELLPSWLHHSFLFLPFWTMSYAPARLASGHLDLWLFGGQVIWLGALLMLATVVFGAGQRRLEVSGG